MAWLAIATPITLAADKGGLSPHPTSRQGTVEERSKAIPIAPTERAFDALIEAQTAGRPSDFAFAAEAMEAVLKGEVPSNRRDELRWYLALAHFKAGQYDRAVDVYAEILDDEDSKYHDGARYLSMNARERALFERCGSETDPCPGARVERVITTPSGRQITVFEISKEQVALITALDDLATRTFTDPEFIDDLDANRFQMAYIAADIYYQAGHFDEARTRFERLIALRFNSEQTADAALAYYDTYVQEEDYEQLKDVCAWLARLGIDGPCDPDRTGRSGWGSAEAAMFNVAFEFIESGNRAAAAATFLAFLEQFPESSNYDEALYNAANNLSLSGRIVEGNRLFATYMFRYPDNDLSKGLYLRMAGYQAVLLDYEAAANTYEQLQRRFPGYEDSPVALLESARLRGAIGDHAGAAQLYERYVTAYPTRPDAEAAFWAAGGQWALVDDASALQFLQRYLALYAGADIKHAIQAAYAIAEIRARRGELKQWKEALRTADALYRRHVADDLDELTRATAAAPEISALLNELSALEVAVPEQSDGRERVEARSAALQAIARRAAALSARHPDFESAMAAAYLEGAAEVARAEVLEAGSLPWQATEARGRAILEAALARAGMEKRWSPWNSRALDLLSGRFPSEFPSGRGESHGSVALLAVPLAGPVFLPSTQDRENAN